MREETKYKITLGLVLALGVYMLFNIPIHAQPPVRLTDGAGREMVAGQAGAGGIRYESGMQTLTASPVALTATKTYVQSIHCANITAGSISVTISNGAGKDFMTATVIPANGMLTANYNAVGHPFVGGIVWNASAGSSLNCSIIGVQ